MQSNGSKHTCTQKNPLYQATHHMRVCGASSTQNIDTLNELNAFLKIVWPMRFSAS